MIQRDGAVRSAAPWIGYASRHPFGTIVSSSEADRTSATVGDSEFAGGRNAQSRDGMNLASNDTRSFSPRCLLPVLVVGVRDRRVDPLVHQYYERIPAGLPHVRRCPLFLNDDLRPSAQSRM